MKTNDFSDGFNGFVTSGFCFGRLVTEFGWRALAPTLKLGKIGPGQCQACIYT